MKNMAKKFLAVCFTALCVVLFLIYTLKDFNEEKSSGIRSMIGEEFGGVTSLSVRENVILTNAVELYLQSLRSGDFDKAYGYISAQYKEIVPKDVYIQKMNEIGLENFKTSGLLEIRQATTNMFIVQFDLANGLKQKILLILDDKNYYIVPEPFLEYRVVDDGIKKDGITYHLNGYEIDLERCVFDFTITNESNDEVKIVDAQMLYETGGSSKAVNSEFVIPAKETKNVSIEVETYLDFPAGFKLTRQDGEKQRIYTFDL
ncbi:MAG: hypothetical protein IJX99_03655 [Clostridia bacterium]|nr:hypothetical protein [Clostridia bacterium]